LLFSTPAVLPVARRAVASATFAVVIEAAAWSALLVFSLLIWLFSLPSQMADWELLLTYTPLLLFCLSCRTVLAASAQKLVEAAGNMTYSSYLLHFPIQLAIALGFALSGRSVPFYDSWFFGMFVLATLLASHLSYRYFEAPAQTLLRSRLLPKRGIAARAFAIVSVDHTRPRQAD
jgi:peptidoglycan/LPS O-acetylase OafA/YrhL